MDTSNNLFTLGLDISATQAQMDKQLKQIAKALSDGKSVQVTGGLNLEQSQKQIQSQLDMIAKNLKLGVQVDASAIKQQTDAINKQLASAVNNDGLKIQVKVDSSGLNTANKDLSQLQQQFKQIRTETQATDSVSQGFFGNLKTQVKDSVAVMLKYQLAHMIIQKTVQAIKTMATAVCDLDATLTEFNKVADLSTKQLEIFADKAFDAADKIGRTGKDMIEAATEFKRAGYDLEQSLEMGNAALVLTNVADGIDHTSDAAGTLISVLKGFNLPETDIMSIVDKMNSVSNQSPVGFDNLANGLERVSGTMSQAGNSIDETIGLLTGGFAQLRNMEKVSTGLITISQRLRAVDEDGEEIDGFSAELEEAFGSIGVAIEDTNGELRSTYAIMSDYAKVFPELTSEQKQYFAELASGKRQVNVFNAIIQQMADVDKAVEQSIDSVGAAERENEIYRQSIQGLKNEFDNQFQMLATEVISSDWIKDLISAGTDLLEVLTNIVKQDDLISGTISVITDGIKGLADIIKDISGNDVMGSLIKGFLTYKTVTKGIDIFNFFKGKSDNKRAMDAFFQSALNGTMQVKDGFLQIGEAEKQILNNKTSGFGKHVLLLVS